MHMMCAYNKKGLYIQDICIFTYNVYEYIHNIQIHCVLCVYESIYYMPVLYISEKSPYTL